MFCVVAIFAIPFIGLSQNASKNTFTFEAGAGLDVYRLQTSQSFQESPAASWNYNAMVGYHFHDRVNLNLEFENHTYLIDRTDTTQVASSDYLGSQRLGIGLRFALVDGPLYQLCIGGTVGGFIFGYEISDSLSTASIRANGIYQTYGITNRFLFGKKRMLGIYLKAGVVNNPMTVRDININGESQESYAGVKVDEYKFNSVGYYLNVGLTLNFSGNRRVRSEFK